MGWRKIMGAEQDDVISKPSIQKVQNIQKAEENSKIKTFVSSVPFVPTIQKVKTPQQKYDDLWKKATALADWVDDSNSTIPWQERAARVPELQKMSKILQELETLIDRKGKVTV